MEIALDSYSIGNMLGSVGDARRDTIKSYWNRIWNTPHEDIFQWFQW